MAANGTYECKDQIPIIVVDGGDLPSGGHGPWVKYRFPWETDEQAQSVLWVAFNELLDLGYALKETGATSNGNIPD